MKNLKKRMLAAVLMAAMALTTFANVTPAEAKSLTAKQYLTKMEKASKKAKSYESKTTSTIKVSMEGQNITTKSVTKSIIFADPMKAKSVTTMTLSGDAESNTKVITYIKQNAKGKLFTYTSMDNGKTYDKEKITGSIEEALGTDTDVSAYKKAKIVKKNVKVNKVNTVQISAQLDPELIGDALDATGASLEGMEATDLAPIKVNIWIDKKTYCPIKMTADMTAYLNGYMKQVYAELGEELTEDVYTKAVTTTTYSKYNKATKFSIPKACK